MSDPRIELVIFDLGRVLIRICDGWSHACERVGLALPASWEDPAVRARVVELGRRHEVGELDCETYFALTAETAGLSPADVKRISEAWLLGPFEGIDDLLNDLEAAGVQTACLSNTNATHWALMHATGGPAALPMRRLRHCFASHLVGVAKPHDAIYEHVERETGLRGGQIVFFDDLQDNVDAAARRGWRAHRIDPTPDDPVPQVRAALARYDLVPNPGKAVRGAHAEHA